MEDSIKRLLTALACILMGTALGVVIMYCSFRAPVGSPAVDPVNVAAQAPEDTESGTQKYREIMDLVDTYFIGDEVDMTAVNDGMAAGMIQGLGDRWSYYVPAEEYQSYQEGINNAYVGVGITIQAKYLDEEMQELQGYEVNEVSRGGPAEEAGVLAGDILMEVNGEKTSGMAMDELRSKVKGEAGTTVDLTFLRGEQTLTLTVERRAVQVIPAEGQLLEGEIGYIQIDNFDGGCAATVMDLVEDLQSQGAKYLLFDVRNNPGGLRSELTDLLDYLLPEGVVFHSVNYAGEESYTMSDEDHVDLPMAVLVNADSYSAAEYFACAIQEYGVGFVAGEHTFGKGYYQLGLNLSDGSAVNLSIGKYYTPGGISLIDVGVTPDVEVALEEDQAVALARGQLDYREDPQMQAAIRRLFDGP